MVNYTYSDDPDSAVKNKLGAVTHVELEKREAKHVFARDAELAYSESPSGKFDAEHLKAIHKHLFQDVYEWAGHTRDEKVQLSDGTVATEPLLKKIDGNLFMVAPLIPDALEAIADKLRDGNYLRGLPREAFAERAADIMAEINAAHPFREGNGRTQRLFIRELAEQAGHELDFSVVSKERMIQVSIAANDRGDNSMMRRLFDEISDPSRVAALIPAIDFLEAQLFPWNDRYVATMEPGHSVEVTLAGIAGEHFMGRTGSKILIGKNDDLPPQAAKGQTVEVKPSRWGEQSCARSEPITASLRVVGVAGGIAIGLLDFVLGLFAAGSQFPTQDTADQLIEQRKAKAALANIRDSMKRGEGLNEQDVRNLTHEHLLKIREHGDDYLREVIDRMERYKARSRDEGRER